ncbi:uracil-DNA glycosylase [Ascobolus immersus RN42]|uniref:Uracil-DNA glycosylase n=1 Tax=Ascobolus immersus RN42 TaxID=1160509 RepID=A0A3N4IP28_ASCIM|nr:uracil-DNA glycosylase [Ascobolus immersus RN42]
MASKRKADPATPAPTKKAKSITSFFTPDRSAPSAPAPAPVITDFDKDAWVATLTPEQKELLQLEIDTLHPSWLALLRDTLVSPTFLNLKKFLATEYKAGKTIYPPQSEIYSWSRYTPVDKVRVLILGQDPYHGPNQAHGLSFSVQAPTPAPPSLKNMFTCLKRDFPTFVPPPNNGGSLIPWAERGVLMLNASLTVRRGEAGSHAKKGWEVLTGRVVEIVTKGEGRVGGKGVVVMAWGNDAAKRCTGIDKKKNEVLYSVHPSPLSAHRGFLTCQHFKKANEWLEFKYGEGIDWDLNTKPKSTAPSTNTKPTPVTETVKKSELKTPATEVVDDDEFGSDIPISAEEEAMLAAAEAEAEATKKGTEVKDAESSEASKAEGAGEEKKDEVNTDTANGEKEVADEKAKEKQ